MARNMEKSEKEFIGFYDKHADAIFRYCYFRVYNREEAKDLTQETFAKIWEYLSNGKEVKNLRAFAYKVALNLIIDKARSGRRTQSLEELREGGFEPAAEGGREEEIDKLLDIERVKKLFNQLDEIYREALILRYVNGLRPKEIAEALGESEDAVSVRIHRGLKMLKKLL